MLSYTNYLRSVCRIVIFCVALIGGAPSQRAFADEKATEHSAGLPNLPDCLQKILDAHNLIRDNGGYEGRQTELGQSFDLAVTHGKEYRDQLYYIYDHANSEGKFLAACLIKRFDSSEGIKRLKELTEDHTITADGSRRGPYCGKSPGNGRTTIRELAFKELGLKPPDPFYDFGEHINSSGEKPKK